MKDCSSQATSVRAELERLTDQLLSPDSENATLRDAATGLHGLLASLSGLTEASANEEDTSSIALNTGLAIAPKDAARSILDYRRTTKFLRGLRESITQAQKHFSNRPLEILYAGCGPFAPLALALATKFSSEEVQFTLLDVHSRSLEIARHIFAAMGLGNHVRNYLEGDAGAYQKPAGAELHVVIVEALQNTLAVEPQVDITLNLAPQLAAGGFFIPARIKIDCYLTDLQREIPFLSLGHDEDSVERPMPAQRALLGCVFELSAVTVGSGTVLKLYHYLTVNGAQLGKELPGQPLSLSPVIVEIPADTQQKLHALLTTTVTVFDSIVIREGESGLTQPAILHDLGALDPGARIEFRYAIGREPGLKYRLLPD
jgi:hypothetical protein